MSSKSSDVAKTSDVDIQKNNSNFPAISKPITEAKKWFQHTLGRIVILSGERPEEEGVKIFLNEISDLIEKSEDVEKDINKGPEIVPRRELKMSIQTIHDLILIWPGIAFITEEEYRKILRTVSCALEEAAIEEHNDTPGFLSLEGSK